MYVFQHTGQLSIEELYSPFGGNSIQATVGSTSQVDSVDATGKPLCTPVRRQDWAPAKPFQMAFGAVYMQQRLGVTDRETMELITESPYLQFFIGLSGYQPLPARRQLCRRAPTPGSLRHC